MSARLLVRLCALVPLLAALPLGAKEEDAELKAAEALLRDGKVGTDGPALLRFFRERTPSPAQRERLARLARELGDDEFEVREKATRALIAAGRPAVPFL